jgi:hypothetical protein
VVDGHFEEKVQREGRFVYVAVDPPLGAEVLSLPESAVEIEVSGVGYYQYDRVFYRRVVHPTRTAYVIVASPY